MPIVQHEIQENLNYINFESNGCKLNVYGLF